MKSKENHEIFISNYTWQEYQKIAKADTILIVPVGAFEQHGPHLPVSTDALIGKAFAERLAKRLNAYAVEPFIYGMRSDLYSGGGESFPGTCSLKPTTFLCLLGDVVNEFYQDGFKRFIFLNAHYENSPLLRETARQHVNNFPDSKVLFCCWWDILSEANIASYFPAEFPGMELEHAGFLETSVMLYLYPHLVKPKEFFPRELTVPPGFELYPEKSNAALSKSGSLAPAHLATREAGKEIVREVVNNLVHIVNSNLGSVSE